MKGLSTKALGQQLTIIVIIKLPLTTFVVNQLIVFVCNVIEKAENNTKYFGQNTVKLQETEFTVVNIEIIIK